MQLRHSELCLSYGAQHGSDAYVNCMLQLHHQELQMDIARIDAIRALRIPAPVTCSTYGNTTTCR
jgi:hypothetical protein